MILKLFKILFTNSHFIYWLFHIYNHTIYNEQVFQSFDSPFHLIDNFFFVTPDIFPINYFTFVYVFLVIRYVKNIFYKYIVHLPSCRYFCLLTFVNCCSQGINLKAHSNFSRLII